MTYYIKHDGYDNFYKSDFLADESSSEESSSSNDESITSNDKSKSSNDKSSNESSDDFK